MSLTTSRAASTARIFALLLTVFRLIAGPAEAAGFVKTEEWKESGPYRFGWAVALSNSGDVALVNNRFLPPGECQKVFRRNPATNQWQPELIQQPPSCPSESEKTLALLSGNGGVIVLVDRVTRYVRSYLFNGATWQIEHTFGPVGSASESFAPYGALSDDGSTLIVGSYNSQSNYSVLHELKRTPSGWSLVQTLQVQFDWGIASLAFSGDGQHLAAASRASPTSTLGYVRLWRRDGAAWVLTSTLSGLAQHPRTLELSDDGSTLLLEDDCGGGYCANVYVRQGTKWFWHQQLVPAIKGETLQPDQTFSFSLSSSGGLAVVGRWNAACGGERCGLVHLFRKQGMAWHYEQTLLPPAGPYSTHRFGFDVGLSADASTLLVGAPYYQCAPNQLCGAAYLYEFNSTPSGPSGNCSGPVMPPGCFEVPMPAYGQTPFVPLGCEIVDCCPLCPLSAEVEWALTLDGAPVRELVVRLERLDAQQLARLRLRGPAQWVEPGLLRIMPGGEVTVSGFSVPRATLRWSVASPRMTFHSVIGANPGPGEIRLRVEQRTPQGPLSESVLVYRLSAPAP